MMSSLIPISMHTYTNTGSLFTWCLRSSSRVGDFNTNIEPIIMSPIIYYWNFTRDRRHTTENIFHHYCISPRIPRVSQSIRSLHVKNGSWNSIVINNRNWPYAYSPTLFNTKHMKLFTQKHISISMFVIITSSKPCPQRGQIHQRWPWSTPCLPTVPSIRSASHARYDLVLRLLSFVPLLGILTAPQHRARLDGTIVTVILLFHSGLCYIATCV